MKFTRSGPDLDAVVEAWLDLATNEGKVVETTRDGTLRSVEAVTKDSYVYYLGDRNHAVIRRGLPPTSFEMLRIQDELLGVRVAVQRRLAEVIGTGNVHGRSTDRIQFTANGVTAVVDVDQATGLVLHEEYRLPNGTTQTTEREYSLIEHVKRTTLPDNVFDADLPRDSAREEYTHGELKQVAAGTSYTVYAATSDSERFRTAFRRVSTVREGPTTDRTTLTYNSDSGEVHLISGLPPDPAFPQELVMVGGTIEVAGILWETDGAAQQGGFRGSTKLGDTHITIFAADQATFERVAASIQPIQP